MNDRRTFFIASLLGLLFIANLTMLVGRGGPSAYAEPALGDALGPADSLELAAPDTDDAVILRNGKGRLAWGDQPYDRSYSLAYVFIGKVLNELMQSEELKENRERMMSDLNDAEADYRERLDAIGERLQQLDPESPDAKALYEEGSVVYQEYMAWQQDAVVQRGRLDAEQLESAYREMIAAVEVVAHRQDIDTVYRFIPPEEAFRADNPEQAMLGIRLRSVLRYPEDLDITDLVLEELSLEVE